MAVHISSENFQLRYSQEEDRLLLAVDISAERSVGIPLTRRLTRALLTALADLVSRQREAASQKSVALSDPSLSSEHKRMVEEAVAKGAIRTDVPPKALASPPKRAHGFKIEERQDGAAALTLDNGEQLVTLHFAADRIHAAMSVLLGQAEAAGWDFPPIAEWLDAARRKRAAGAETRLVH